MDNYLSTTSADGFGTSRNDQRERRKRGTDRFEVTNALSQIGTCDRNEEGMGMAGIMGGNSYLELRGDLSVAVISHWGQSSSTRDKQVPF